MTIDASRNLLYTLTGLIVVVRTYQLIRMDWSRPLKHGSGFFLNIEVPPSFYSSEGARWLARYRAGILGEYAIESVVLVLLLASGQWRWLPAWAGGSAALYVASQGLLGLWAQAALGGVSTQRTVALSLEPRQVGRFLSWPLEALMAITLVTGWFVLLDRGDSSVQWGSPATATYVVLALFVAKIVHIKAAAPLPADRTSEHQQYFDARRRQDLRLIDSMRWLFLFVFGGYALLHGWPAAQQMAGLRWFLIAGGVAIWLAMVAMTIVGLRRLDTIGRGLRPPASWGGPFRGSPWASRGGGIWAVTFVAGLAVLFAIFGV